MLGSGDDRATIPPAEIIWSMMPQLNDQNSILCVVDANYDQDRLHASETGIAVSKVRYAAIKLIRGWGYCNIPHGWRAIPARTNHGLAFAKGLRWFET